MFRRCVNLVWVICAFLTLSACGTLTGIPSHGGGKRFATEQKLVAASVRAALKSTDVSILKGHKVALVVQSIADTGGGNLSGGRITLGTLLQAGTMVSPVGRTANTMQVFDLVNTNTNFQNTQSTTDGSVTTNLGSTTNGTTTQTTTTTGTVAGGGTTTTINNPETTTTTTTGDVTTTQTTGAATTTSTTTGETQTHNLTNTTNGTNTSSTSSNSTETTDMEGTNNATGGSTTNHQVVESVGTRTQNRGPDSRARLHLGYNGMGDYSNLRVSASDIAFFTHQLTSYLRLSGVKSVTSPRDPSATALLFVSVDVFGTIRSRFDSYIYNKETVKAETGLEMFAFDKKGRLIMKPQSSNYEAQYGEHYLVWAGPYQTDHKVKKGKGLLVDFSDVPNQTSTETNTQRQESFKVP